MTEHILAAPLVALTLAVATPARADDVALRREALLDLSLSIEAFEGQTVDIRCPLLGADIRGFTCVVVNSAVKTVGTLYVSNSQLLLADKKATVERCIDTRTVKSDCVANMQVTVKDGIARALSLVWVPGSS